MSFPVWGSDRIAVPVLKVSGEIGGFLHDRYLEVKAGLLDGFPYNSSELRDHHLLGFVHYIRGLVQYKGRNDYDKYY